MIASSGSNRRVFFLDNDFVNNGCLVSDCRTHIVYAVNDGRNIASEGWHVPTIEDWETLVANVRGTMVGGGKLKA